MTRTRAVRMRGAISEVLSVGMGERKIINNRTVVRMVRDEFIVDEVFIKGADKVVDEVLRVGPRPA